MTPTCHECGAPLHDHQTCQAQFEELLALEFSSPPHGQVHLLTVACFMIQHNRYSDEALTWMADQLRAHLEQGLSPALIRSRAARAAMQPNRTWKIPRQPEARPLPVIPWSLSIADPFSTRHNPVLYCAMARRWAAATLAEMQPLLPPA
jgi:hypothetical protein